MLTAKTVNWAFLLLASPAILHGVLRAAAAGTELIVPEDSSLSISEYGELGVPDPSRPWTSGEYERALRVLEELPRPQLPRASGPSRLLFDRLLLSYRREFELPYGNGSGEGATEESLPQDLPAVYSPEERDGLLFDKELIAIRAEALSRTLETVPTRAKLLAQVEGFAQMMKRTSSETERVRFSEGMRRAEEAAERVSHLVRSQTSELLVVASIPQVADPARQLLLRKAQVLVPRLPQFLEARDVQWVATLLKGSADSEVNASIGPGLLALAKELEAATKNT